MTKPQLIKAIVKATGVEDPTKDYDFLNDQTPTYLKKLLAVINALPS